MIVLLPLSAGDEETPTKLRVASDALDLCNLLNREPITPLVQRRERGARPLEVAGIARHAWFQIFQD